MSHRPFLAASAALLLLCGLAGATDFVAPKQTIVGAEEPVALGELVTLSLSAADKTASLSQVAVAWKVFDGEQEKRFAVDAEGKVFFGAGIRARKLLAVASVTYLFVVKDGDKITEVGTRTVILTARVVIGEPDAPPPDVKPPAPPAPKPDSGGEELKDGKFKLSKFARDGAAGKVAAAGRADGARALAASFRKVAKTIAAGELTDVADILKETKKSNDAALGQSSAAWAGFAEALQEKLLALFEAGTLQTTADFATGWEELALGLDKVS